LYKGDSIYLEYNRVPYQFYQYGFGKLGPVEQTFTQSGVISSLLFNGNYKFIVPNGQGLSCGLKQAEVALIHWM
jgi:hypothetical protein